METTVAIAILVGAIVAPLSLASQSIRSASASRNDIIVVNLAEEGIELIKNYRSNNIIKGLSWTDGMDSCFNANGCQIDALSLNIQACGSSCDFFKLDPSLGIYNYQTGSDTIFKRTMNITNVNADVEIQVNSLISWSDRFGDHSFSLKTSMLNW